MFDSTGGHKTIEEWKIEQLKNLMHDYRLIIEHQNKCIKEVILELENAILTIKESNLNTEKDR